MTRFKFIIFVKLKSIKISKMVFYTNQKKLLKQKCRQAKFIIFGNTWNVKFWKYDKKCFHTKITVKSL